MKKLIAMLLTMTLTLGLAACAEQEVPKPSKPAVTQTEKATQPEATQPEQPTQSERPTQPEQPAQPETKPEQPVHTHSYSAKVTKAASCTQAGTKTFTCSCGSAYTEAVAAKGHSYKVTDSKPLTCTQDGYTTYTCACGDTYTKTQTAQGHQMSGWQEYSKGTNHTPGEKRNSCANCDHYQSEKQYARILNYYAQVGPMFGDFTSAEEFREHLDRVIDAAFYSGDVKLNTTQDPENGGLYYHTIKISDMDAFTEELLGTTFDYTGVDRLPVMLESSCSYDPDQDALVIRAYAVGGDGYSEYQGMEYTTEDEIHFTVTAQLCHYYPGGQYMSSCTVAVELVDGNYIVTGVGE